jgi:hypothetical protein
LASPPFLPINPSDIPNCILSQPRIRARIV